MALKQKFALNLAKNVIHPVIWNAPLSAWTTFRIGGPADALVTVDSADELIAVIGLCCADKVAWKIIGKGSNIIAPDQGFRGVIIVLGTGFDECARSEERTDRTVVVSTGAATGFSRLAEWAASEGLCGLEFAAGIPGSIGGAVTMNAGAWGHQTADVIHRLFLVHEAKEIICERKDLHFSYRCWDDLYSDFKGAVITAVELLLTVGKTTDIKQTMRALRRKRQEKQPLGMPNAGSFFKNPKGESAGKLIESGGLKGLRVGDAEVSEKHANFFVNRGQATAADVLELMKRVSARVKETSGFDLEPEVHFL